MGIESTGSKSIHHGKKDFKRAEKLGILDQQQSAVWSDSLKWRLEWNRMASRAQKLREKMDDGSLTIGDLTEFIQDIEEPPDF